MYVINSSTLCYWCPQKHKQYGILVTFIIKGSTKSVQIMILFFKDDSKDTVYTKCSFIEIHLFKLPVLEHEKYFGLY